MSNTTASMTCNSSAPPVIMTDWRPYRKDSYPYPMPWLPEVHALHVGITRPVSWKKRARLAAQVCVMKRISFIIAATSWFDWSRSSFATSTGMFFSVLIVITAVVSGLPCFSSSAISDIFLKPKPCMLSLQ